MVFTCSVTKCTQSQMRRLPGPTTSRSLMLKCSTIRGVHVVTQSTCSSTTSFPLDNDEPVNGEIVCYNISIGHPSIYQPTSWAGVFEDRLRENEILEKVIRDDEPQEISCSSRFSIKEGRMAAIMFWKGYMSAYVNQRTKAIHHLASIDCSRLQRILSHFPGWRLGVAISCEISLIVNSGATEGGFFV
jgi:hypothetical protein